MSFVTIRLPELKDFKKELEDKPERIKYYNKYGGYTGSSESIDYLILKLKEYYASRED